MKHSPKCFTHFLACEKQCWQQDKFGFNFSELLLESTWQGQVERENDVPFLCPFWSHCVGFQLMF